MTRGRRVPRWNLADWIVVAVPVATANFLWMFCAFLGIARPWNYVMPLRDVLEIAAALYLVVQFGVFTILAMAGHFKQTPHTRDHAGLVALQAHLRARRLVLFDGFLELWGEYERKGFRARLEYAVGERADVHI